MNGLKCYCCGATLGKSFSLVAMSDNMDRVFVMLNEHAVRAEDAVTIISVERIARRPAIKAKR